jgi:hypothetical protein
MKKIIVAALLAFVISPAKAQSAASETQQLMSWLATQQANIGASENLHGTKFAATWWDVLNAGQSGVNIAAGSSKDFVDLGPAVCAANSQATRYGAAIPINAGNIWNWASGKVPPKFSSHIHIATLPSITLSPILLWPNGRPLKTWHFGDDFQIALAYTFGGAANATP